MDDLSIHELIVVTEDSSEKLKAILFNEVVHVVQFELLTKDAILRNAPDHLHDEVLVPRGQSHLVLRYEDEQLDELPSKSNSEATYEKDSCVYELSSIFKC